MIFDFDQAQDGAAAVVFMLMKQMIDAGVPHQKALRDVSVGLLQGTYGSAVWKELGMTERTVERWRAETREVMAAAPEIDVEPPAAVIESFQRLMAQKAGR